MADFNDIDITQDLTGGPGDAAYGDAVTPNQTGDAKPVSPDGAGPTNAQPGRKAVEAPAEKPADENVSLRDQLSNAFKEDEKPASEPTTEQKAAPALTKDSEGKYRNADGTFASAEDVAAFEAASKPAEPAAPVAEPQAVQQYDNLLVGMTPIEQQQFQSLPAELRDYLGRTMEGLNVRAQRLGEYDLIEQQILGPRRDALAANGTTVPVALSNLFALSDFASRDPAQFVMWFSQQNNLDLDALLDEQEAANGGPVDPNVQALQGTVQQLQGFVNQTQQQRAQQEQEARLQEVRNFSTEKDEAGQLKRPYLTEVMTDWAAQIAAYRTANPNLSNAEVLQKAYEVACYANPAVRAKIQQAAADKQKQTAAERTTAAKAAGASVTGAPAGAAAAPANNSARTLREELEAGFAQYA